MNEREQEKIDAKLVTSGEERSEKQQSKKGLDWTKINEDEREGEGKWLSSNLSLLFAEVSLL